MPHPYNPSRWCSKCHTELVEDGYGQKVHLYTATIHCPDREKK